jgi:hypothetical protein
VTGAAGIMGAVNYENRTGLQPPEQVVSASLRGTFRYPEPFDRV